MEAYEAFVAVALEAEGFVVSGPTKFPVTRQTAKAKHVETQTHGYEVDVVAARADCIVLATVKSFFGSRGVVADHVTGATANKQARDGYRLLNDPIIREQVVDGVCTRYGYRRDQVHLRLYVGRFAAPKKGTNEAAIRLWCDNTVVGGGPIQVVGVEEVVERVRGAAAHKQYRDNAVLVSMKVLQAAGVLTLDLPDDVGQDVVDHPDPREAGD